MNHQLHASSPPRLRVRTGVLRIVSLLLLVSLLGGCATPPPARDYTKFRQARPSSVLVLPPVNETPDVQATASVHVQLGPPLAEAGYYVLPVSLVDETLKMNGVQTAADAHNVPPSRLREVFGADAALYVTIKRYGSVYRVVMSETAVELEARLVDLRDGELLWDGKALASSAEQGGSNQGGLAGLLIKAIVEQIASNVVDHGHVIAGIASQRLLSPLRHNGILAGPRAPPDSRR